MDITKFTLRGALALVIMAVAVLGFRGHHLAQRDACGKRLAQVVPALGAYAAAHQGRLPADADTLKEALGAVPVSSDGQPFALASEPLTWGQTPRRPYLWDARPHPFVDGVHVLATDGKVYQLKRLEDLPQ